MPFEIPGPKNLNYKDGSSAIIVDIRGSTEIVRKKSYSLTEEKYNEALLEHTDLMMGLFRKVFDCIESFSIGNSFSFNDTGDGCLCVFWDKSHPLTCLRIACVVHEHLSKDEYAQNNNIGFGIGLHTGGCLIYRTSVPARDFVFGIVANTAARVEKFTKNIKDADKNRGRDPRLVFTWNFKDNLEKLLDDEEKKAIRPISAYRLYINDGKDEGHFLYTLAADAIERHASYKPQV